MVQRLGRNVLGDQQDFEPVVAGDLHDALGLGQVGFVLVGDRDDRDLEVRTDSGLDRGLTVLEGQGRPSARQLGVEVFDKRREVLDVPRDREDLHFLWLRLQKAHALSSVSTCSRACAFTQIIP